jgi:hypothetical protein
MIQIQHPQRGIVLIINVIRYRAEKLISRKIQQEGIRKLHSLMNNSGQVIVIDAEKSPVVRSVRADVDGQCAVEFILTEVDLFCEMEVVDGGGDGARKFVFVQE